MTDQPVRAVAELSFGEAITELESVVAALESGQLELEDSMARYERGVALLRDLQTRIVEAQQKVTMLIGELDADSLSGDEGNGDE